MDVLELERIEASLSNPDDPAEVTLVADVAGVGTTQRLATGQILKWTPDMLRKFAPTLLGKPVNVELNEAGEPTGHTRTVIGAITKSTFDEVRQVVTVEAALWRHYFGATVARLKELGSRLQASIEFLYSASTDNGDGSITPTEGEFSGLGIVRVGADPRNRVLLLASLAEDEASRKESVTDKTTIMARLERFLFGEDAERVFKPEPTPEADNKVIDASQADADHEEDAALATELSEEQKAALRAEILAELKPQLEAADEASAIKAERDALLAEKAANELNASKDALAASRAEELETILPVKTDAGKARRLAAVRELDEAAYEALKAELVEAAEPKGGIHSDAEAHAAQDEHEDDAVSEETLAKYRAEATAAVGFAAPKGKE